MPDPVTVITADHIETVTLSSAELEKWWIDAAGETYAARQGLQVLLDVVKGSGANDGQFSFRPSGWEIQLSRATAQVLLSSAILGAVLTVIGADQLPAAVLTAVIPLLFDVKTANLSSGERYLLARLREVPDAIDTETTAEDLYALLPQDIRAQTTLVDFLECQRSRNSPVAGV